jgi:zinc D-Ala-D-Ala carboxypeptidase
VPAGLTVPNLPLRTNANDPEMHVQAETALAMEQMFAAAKADGLNLMLASGYRSYSEQSILYARYSAQSGVQQADTFSARPGHSEHQTGLAADIEPASRQCEVDQCFADTPEGLWLAANSYKYGFIIRYQKTTQALTGYEYEPWHVRYLSTDLAQQLHSSGQTLEQFFDLPTYSSYPAAGYELKS